MKVKVKVHTNCKNKKIERDNNGIIQVYITQKPIEGRANEEVIEMIAKYFGVKLNQVFIELGIKSREKVFEIDK